MERSSLGNVYFHQVMLSFIFSKIGSFDLLTTLGSVALSVLGPWILALAFVGDALKMKADVCP